MNQLTLSFTGAYCKCGRPSRPSGGNCHVCHAAYMRDFRKTHEECPTQKARRETRAKTRLLVSQGKIRKGVCEVCNSPDVEAHHDDYSDPWRVRWFCVLHHVEFHRAHHSASSTSYFDSAQIA